MTQKILTKHEMQSHIESLAKKNCLYNSLLKMINSLSKDNKEKFWERLENKKFSNITDLDIYLESL